MSQTWGPIRVMLAHVPMLNMGPCGLSSVYTKPTRKWSKVDRESVHFGPLDLEARNAMFGPPVWGLGVMTLAPRGGGSHLGTT